MTSRVSSAKKETGVVNRLTGLLSCIKSTAAPRSTISEKSPVSMPTKLARSPLAPAVIPGIPAITGGASTPLNANFNASTNSAFVKTSSILISGVPGAFGISRIVFRPVLPSITSPSAFSVAELLLIRLIRLLKSGSTVGMATAEVAKIGFPIASN